ncbi:MAG: hypothetical protein Q9160_006867 [Pyrenula sp. 1 TL-2023]
MDDLVHVERPSSALSASWATLSNADILSNSSSALEDDAQSQSTDAVSLLDQNIVDDANSMDEDSDSAEEDVYNDHTELSDLSRGQYLDEKGAEHGQDSEMTARLHGTDAIEFEEPQSWPDPEMVNLKHTIHIFDDHEARAISQKLRPRVQSDPVFDALVGTTRMTMSKRILDRNRPLRVIYAGDSWGRQKILEKLGDVLLSGRSNDGTNRDKGDRYSIVAAQPNGSFSETTPPDTQILVHDCLASAAAEEVPGTKSITLSFRNIALFTSRLNGLTASGRGKYTISSRSQWNTPDLAVLFISHRDHSNEVKDFYQNVHTFMQRHHIPCMKVVENNAWTLEDDFSPIDLPTLHLCVESRISSGIEAAILKRLPVDLDTYESIESSQLNRNLAYLRSLASAQEESSSQDNQETEDSTDDQSGFDLLECIRCNFSDLLERSPLAGNPHAAWLLNHPAIGLGFLICCVSLLGIASYLAIQLPVLMVTALTSSLLNQTELSPATSSQNVSAAAPVTPTSTYLFRPSSTPSTKELSLQSDLPKSLAEVQQHLDLSQILADPILYSSNRSEKVQVHVVGDCHLIIKLPQRLYLRKKLNSFEVTLERGDRIINSTTMKLFDGVYTVKVASEEAYGPLNVTVTSTKPYLSETFAIDFGASWLKPAGWKKAAQVVTDQFRKDLQSAQSSIQVAYQRVSEGAQTALQGTSKKAGEKSGELQARYRKLVEQKSGQLTKLFQDIEHTLEIRRLAEMQMREQLEAVKEGANAYARNTGEVACVIAKDISRIVLRNARKLQIATTGFDAASLGEHLKKAKKSRFLATAQSRAQGVIKSKDTPTSEQSDYHSREGRAEKCGGSCKARHR